MATILNVFDLAKRFVLPDDILHSPDSQANKSSHFLVMTNTDAIVKDKGFSVDTLLQETPAISCRLNFIIFDQDYLRGSVEFSGETLNMQYEISLYNIESDKQLQFFETLNVANITKESTYFFTKKYRIFNNPNAQSQRRVFIDNYFFIYCKITKKEILPIKLLIQKNEMPRLFEYFYENKRLIDYNIICQGKMFPVHKLILAHRSVIFRSIFESQVEECLDDELKINEFRPETVEQMLRYIYTDDIAENICEEDLQMLLLIAIKYALEGLKVLCMQRLSKLANSLGKAIDVIKFAEAYDIIEFKEAMFQFITDNQHVLLK